MNGELLLHMAAPLVAAVLIAVALLPFRRRHLFYPNRSESFDVASLRRLCATS
jgi:hypothetical protein